MSFADITVVGITGADSYTEGTMYAIIRSCIAGLGFEIRASEYCYTIFFRSTVYQSNEECPFRARLWGALDGKCGLDRLQPYPFYPIKW